MAIALVPAAGSGERLAANSPKALVELAGRPLLYWSLQALAKVGAIEQIVVALPPEHESHRQRPDKPAVHPPVMPTSVQAPAGTLVVAGGRTRSESVRLALAAASGGDPVLVHDAARPLLSPELADAVLAACPRDGVSGAIAAARVSDTIKRAGADGVVVETLARPELWAVQTPQVFRRAALERALDVPEEILATATDDAWLVERSGGKVVVVPAPRENVKVTTPLDLVLAEALLARRGAAPAAGRE
jgi:2-C-methyl-D-erythritol 4-phosphate cytidylyltransferase